MINVTLPLNPIGRKGRAVPSIVVDVATPEGADRAISLFNGTSESGLKNALTAIDSSPDCFRNRYSAMRVRAELARRLMIK